MHNHSDCLSTPTFAKMTHFFVLGLPQWPLNKEDMTEKVQIQQHSHLPIMTPMKFGADGNFYLDI